VQKYDTIKALPSDRFRRLTGVSKSVFQIMVSVIQVAEHQRMKKGGKPSYLKPEDKLLMTLEYLREYRTYFHLGQSYGLSESACYRNCKWIEEVLVRDKTFALHQAQIVQQRQPNGNLIEYAYSDFNEEKSKVRYYLLRKVTALPIQVGSWQNLF
jgi:hypothetical protein